MWSEDRVREYFDTHWDITLRELSRISGWSVNQLKTVLLGG